MTRPKFVSGSTSQSSKFASIEGPNVNFLFHFRNKIEVVNTFSRKQ